MRCVDCVVFGCVHKKSTIQTIITIYRFLTEGPGNCSLMPSTKPAVKELLFYSYYSLLFTIDFHTNLK